MALEDHVFILISSDILVLMVILWLPGRVSPLCIGNTHWSIEK